jgi:hypothetical protein
MNMDAIPIWVLIAATIVIVMIAAEGGYWLGQRAQRRAHRDTVPPVSSIVGSSLALLAFMLAFTFSIVASRYDSRRALVRDEANLIRTVWLRSDFLPEPDRGETAALIRGYLDDRVTAAESRDPNTVNQALKESIRIQHRIWDIAVSNGRQEMNSPIAALYLTSLNQMIDMHALRVTIGLDARIPIAIWLALYALIILGMISVGYQTVIAEATGRSRAPLILALSFSVVIALITSLDRPMSGFMTISQQPLKNIRTWIDSGANAGPNLGDKR